MTRYPAVMDDTGGTARTQASRTWTGPQSPAHNTGLASIAAKNHHFVTVVVDPEDYVNLIPDLEAHDGRLDLAKRFALARKAFAHTARYEAAISQFLAGQDPGAVASAYTAAIRSL